MRNQRLGGLKNLLLFTQLGLSVISPILVCVFIGWLLQKYLNAPAFVMVICILLGLISGLLSAWKLVQRMLAISQEEVSGTEEKEDRQ